MDKYAGRPVRTQTQIDNQTLIFNALWGFLNEHATTPVPNGVCLEFGSGRFGYVDFYKQHFKKSFALDIYDFAEYYDDVDYLLSEDQLTIPLPDSCVDLVASHSVLEHVMDIDTTIAEIDRVLRVGGLALLTVSPLYWSYCGGHLYTKDRKRLENWEHLDPDSEYFMEGRDTIEINMGGFLNRLTMSQLLAAVGKVPWHIEKLEVKGNVQKKLPDFLKRYDRPLTDFHTKEFKLLIRKVYQFEGDTLLPVNKPPQQTPLWNRFFGPKG